MLTHTPSGLQEIIQTFGALDNDFEARHIVVFDLPYPLHFGSHVLTRTRCHALLVDNFQGVFREIKRAGLESLATNYSGIYNDRSIRGQISRPSTHSWGIAVDMEAALYPLGSLKRFDQRIVDIFKAHGFFYGGDFKDRKDSMHFQFATGY